MAGPTLPYELLYSILADVIGQNIHFRLIVHASLDDWDAIFTLTRVSNLFRSIVIKLSGIIFGPLEGTNKKSEASSIYLLCDRHWHPDQHCSSCGERIAIYTAFLSQPPTVEYYYTVLGLGLPDNECLQTLVSEKNFCHSRLNTRYRIERIFWWRQLMPGISTLSQQSFTTRTLPVSTRSSRRGYANGSTLYDLSFTLERHLLSNINSVFTFLKICLSIFELVYECDHISNSSNISIDEFSTVCLCQWSKLLTNLFISSRWKRS